MHLVKKAAGKYITGVFLLCCYLLGISPVWLYHHHEHHFVAYEKADDCEKVIYYADSSGSCKHRQHLSVAVEKCSLCDHHTVSAHMSASPSCGNCKDVIADQYHFPFVFLYSSPVDEFANRGPPVI